jgi:hypothetical protein
VFEKRAFRRIFWSKERRNDMRLVKLHNEGLHNLYSSSSIIIMVKSRRMRLVGRVARVGEKNNVYRILVGNPEVKRPLGIHRSKWENNIKIDLGEIG